MAPRNLIQEILEIRSRLRYGHSFNEFSIRLHHLGAAYKKRDEVDPEFLSYFPVALIACFEGFFRLASKELMDAGPPYLGNAARLSVNIKFDLESVVALHGRRTTIGEFIAHHLTWNNLAAVEANMSAILGKSFLEGVRSIPDRVGTEIYGRPLAPILADPDSTFAAVSRAFELRHIICHETATSFKVAVADAESIYTSCTEFLTAANEVVSETLHPNAPLTQAAMNQSSYAECQAVRDEMTGLVELVSMGLTGDTQKQWRELQASWEAFANLAVKFEGSKYEGGSIQPLIHNTTATSLVRARIEQLKRQLDDARRDAET